MDNQNSPLNNQTSTDPQQPTPTPVDPAPQSSMLPPPPPPSVSEPPQPPLKEPRNWLMISAIAVGIILLVALIPFAYMMGSNNSKTDSNKNIEANTSSTSDNKTEEEIEEPEADPVEELDKYAGWSTYESAVYGYTFKYPANWVVERTAPTEPADWVSVNPPAAAGNGGADVLSVFTYFDGTGCPATKTRDFQVAGYTVKGTACVEAEVYNLSMKHSKTVGRDGQGVVLARAASDAVGIRVDMSRGEDEAIQLILDSITGLTPQ